MTSTGLAAFAILCRCADDLEAVRQRCREGSPAWTAMTQLVQAVDRIIDGVVESDGVEEDEP